MSRSQPPAKMQSFFFHDPCGLITNPPVEVEVEEREDAGMLSVEVDHSLENGYLRVYDYEA